MFLWESIPPLSSFSMAMSFHGLCSGPQWPHVASICRGRILRLAFQSTVLAWKLPMASTFELASRWEEYGKNCGALKLFVHLCAELPHKQGWPAINDYILEFYRIWTHIKTLYIRMCIIIMYIYIYSIMILYNYIHIIPNTSKYSSHRPMKFWRPGWQFWRLPKAWD